jgi:hypothetical protein
MKFKPILCRLVTDFVDKVLRENASRASAREPPLTYREAKERWGDTLEKRAGFGARSSAANSFARDGGSGPNTRSGQANPKRARAGAQSRGKDAKTAAGEPVCFHYNRKNGCNRAKKGAGCDDGRGGTYVHVCNFETAAGKFCLAQHTRVGNH